MITERLAGIIFRFTGVRHIRPEQIASTTDQPDTSQKEGNSRYLIKGENTVLAPDREVTVIEADGSTHLYTEIIPRRRPDLKKPVEITLK